MKYRKLGRTDLQVSEIGLGAWQIGGALRAYFDELGWIAHGWGAADDDASVALIHACQDEGINFIDTAAGYGAGHSEQVIGRALQGRRDRWIVETKGGEGFTEDGHNWHDFSRATLLRQIEESLQRLATDYVDVYLLHGPSLEDVRRGECLQALDQIKRAGKARWVGVSLGSGELGLELVAAGAVDVLQLPLSIMDPALAERLVPAAARADVGIVARGALGAGFFTGALTAEETFADDDRRSWQSQDSKAARAAVAQAFRFLETPGRSLTQSLLKYPLSFEGVSTVIPGSKNPEHMRHNAAASDAPDLTPEELERIRQVREHLRG